MRIHLLAIGQKMPAWVEAGYVEYAGRLPRECELRLVEIAAGRRTKNADVARILKDEGERTLAAVPKGAHVVALDVRGREHTTEALAQRLAAWLADGRDVALLVGGPEGLDAACTAAAGETWSLSRLTFPHPLVRIVVAESLYRAWTLLINHPYHRA